MGNLLNYPYMELEGNQTTKKTSIDPDCFEEKCHFLGGEGVEEGWGAQN